MYVYGENRSDKWVIPGYTTKKCYVMILYHAVQNRVAENAMKHIVWCFVCYLQKY